MFPNKAGTARIFERLMVLMYGRRKRRRRALAPLITRISFARRRGAS